MGRAVHPHIITPDSALGGSVIQRSLRFNRGEAPYLQATLGNGDEDKWTWSGWVKKTVNGQHQNLFSSGSYSVYTHINFDNIDRLRFQNWHSGQKGTKITTRLLRDNSAWMHIVVIWDSGNSTADDRMRLYINGTRETSFSSSTNPDQNQDSVINGNSLGGSTYGEGKHFIGKFATTSDNSGTYKTEIHFIDGQAYDPSYFGYTEPLTGIWRPKKYEGTYGTNGFYLDFSDNSATTAVTLGKDRSGNGNDFTPNNFSVAAGEGNDSSLDTPTNNLCTLNPLERFTHNCTLSNGNLKATGPNISYPGAAADVALSSGKWYYEFQINTKTSAPMCGVIKNNYVSGGAGRILYRAGGHYVMYDGSEPTDPDSFDVGDIIGVAIDLDDAAGKIRFYKNGTLQTVNSNLNSLKSQLSISTLGGLLPYIQMYNNDVCTVNFGQRPFSYTPPSGHKKITPNTNNNSLDYSTPSILDPKEHFEPLIYTGTATGSGTQTISDLEFAPDFVWIKSRAIGYSHLLVDTVRGASKGLLSESTDAEETSNGYGMVTAFEHNGFTMTRGSNDGGKCCENTQTYVAWCWKAGGNSNTFNVDGVGYASASAAGITDGTVALTGASVNTKAGFSIVTYSGNNSGSTTFGHGLTQAPEIWFNKSRDNSENWRVYYTVADGSYDFMYLNTTGAVNHSGYALPTSTLINKADDNGERMVAYCWHSVPGYSKFGVYTGNGNADGPFLYIGFRPALIIIKRTDTAENWWLYDNKRDPDNPMTQILYGDQSNVEISATGDDVSNDFVSNGVKLRTANVNWNANGGTYIYMAYAEQPGGVTPFQISSNAR